MKYRPNRLSIEVIKERMQDSKLELLSTTYKNNHEHLQWKCKVCGYTFPRSWGKIQASERCDDCAGRLPVTIARIKRYIKDNDLELELLSTEYVDNTSDLWFKHNKEGCGYKFPRSWRNLRRNHKCPDCEMKQPITIESIKEEFKDKPVKLLSTEYKNNDTDLEWECTVCGHVFPRDYENISRSTKCPKCEDRWDLTLPVVIERLNNIHIGVILTVYTDKDTILDVYCLQEGCSEKWKASYNQIMRDKKRCPEHYGIQKYTLQSIKDKLIKDNRNIKLLTEAYTDIQTNMLWECLTCGYIWEATTGSVLSAGTGCSNCANNLKGSVEKIKQELLNLNIPLEYVSGEYKNQNSILYWKCSNPKCNKIFPKTWEKIKNRDKGCLFCKRKDRQTSNKKNAERNKEQWLKEKAYVYIIHCCDEYEQFYKIGYTKNKPKYRLQAIPYKTEVIKVIETNRYDGIYIEADLQDFHRAYAYDTLKKFGGYRECFSHIHIRK